MGSGLSKRNEEKTAGAPAWMITFSDLSTLLLTFFVLLLSMTTMDRQTLKSMFHNFTASCGILNFKEYGEIYRPKMALMQSLREKLKDSLVVKKSDEAVKDLVAPQEENTLEETGSNLVFEEMKSGFKLVFGHKLLFPTGSADMGEEIKPVLKKIGAFMRNSDYQIYIDGHTDNIPMRGERYSSNEELSLARAFNLMEYFVIQEEIPSQKIALAGYGEFHPVDTNDTPLGRSRNRRVEIIFKNQQYF